MALSYNEFSFILSRAAADQADVEEALQCGDDGYDSEQCFRLDDDGLGVEAEQVMTVARRMLRRCKLWLSATRSGQTRVSCLGLPK
jgi:hypothetical protein